MDRQANRQIYRYAGRNASHPTGGGVIIGIILTCFYEYIPVKRACY